MAILRARGVTLTVLPAEYAVGWPGGSLADAYRTSDLAEAMAYGLAMDEPPEKSPPLGPMGTAKAIRRGRMHAHNRRLAARRSKNG